jgi:ornithine cyclodeaminase/alanine dehydrogenase-like protein (mu-crystallin family)
MCKEHLTGKDRVMKRIELLYLSQEDVISVGITMEETIPIVEDALREHGLSETENPPKPGVHPRNAFIDFNYDLAIEDLAVAMEIYSRAKAQGLGMVLPLIEGELSYA